MDWLQLIDLIVESESKIIFYARRDDSSNNVNKNGFSDCTLVHELNYSLIK